MTEKIDVFLLAVGEANHVHGNLGRKHSEDSKRKMSLIKSSKFSMRIKNGYYVIKNRNHPKTTRDGYMMVHRLIYEKYYNCCLLDWAEIHHINGKPDDNRIENLTILSHGKHSSITNTKEQSDRVCNRCKRDFNTLKNTIKNFRKWCRDIDDKNKWLCRSCFITKHRNRIRNGEW